jgi:glycosyltransferase involved in cell wall biosynthesis
VVDKLSKNIFFSIIVPVYNVEAYLEQCIDSILSQTYSNFEIIMVNDGSTDSSAEICSKYEKKDCRNIIIHKENKGLSDARNVGLLKAKGDYVIFTDSDDYWQGSQVLEELNSFIKNTSPDMIIHEESRYFSDKNVKCKFNQQYIKNRSGNFKKEANSLVYYDLFTACAWDKIIRRSILIEHKLFFPVGRRSEDMEWCSALMNHIYTFFIYPKSFYVYRQGRPGSITLRVSERHIMDVYEMLKNGLKEVEINETRHINQALENYWAAIYVILLKDYYVLSSERRKDIWEDLVSWKGLLTKGRNIKLDQVMKFYGFLPFFLLPVFLYIYRLFNIYNKKYKTLG